VNVFVLQHSYEQGDCTETKMIGVYSSREQAERAIDRLREVPGFIDRPEDFYVDEYRLDKDQWAEGFTTVCCQ
jgi:hypothetical protein